MGSGDENALLHAVLTSRVYDVARETPLDPAPRLSRRLGGATVLLKREDLQPVFSFKLRGAHNKIAHLSPEERAKGVIAASAGNHAQGVAYSARHLGVRAVIVMPKTTPEIKVEAVAHMGAEVVLVGDSYSDAKAHCDVLVRESGLVSIPPFDDPLVIAGQGTIGEEILRQGRGELDAVFVAVGGGGLIAGIAGYVKALMPRVKIVGVEPYEADAMYRSLQAGHRVTLDHVGIFADGVAVREVGELTFELAAALRGRGDPGLERRDLRRHQGRLRRHAECHGARGRARGGGPQVVGGLARRARPAARRHLERRQHELRPSAVRGRAGRAGRGPRGAARGHDPRAAGAFREFCSVVGARVVTEFNYRLAGRAAAHIFVGLKTKSRQDALDVAQNLRERGYPTADLTDNEMAKLHVRHMVGGRAADVKHERLYRFEFPERPGALMRVPREARRPLEHQPLPLSQPRGRLRPRARGLRGPRRRRGRVRVLPRRARLSLGGRGRQRGLRPLPRE